MHRPFTDVDSHGLPYPVRTKDGTRIASGNFRSLLGWCELLCYINVVGFWGYSLVVKWCKILFISFLLKQIYSQHLPQLPNRDHCSNCLCIKRWFFIKSSTTISQPNTSTILTSFNVYLNLVQWKIWKFIYCLFFIILSYLFI